MNIILGIGIIMLIGFVGGRIASCLKLPSLTGYIIFGLLCGPYVGRLLPEGLILQIKNPVSLVAVSIIAFMLGGDISLKSVKQHGLQLVKIAFADSLLTFLLVLLGLYYLAGQKIAIAIPLAALAVSPAPTVIVPIVKELKARGHFTHILLMLSALEDISCVIFISIAIAVSRTLIAGGSPSFQAILLGFGEVIGSVIAGLILGLITTVILRKLPPGNPHLLFTLAMILSGAGITTITPLSALITILAMGVVVYNYAGESHELFAGIEKIANPILLLFFTAAGATLKPGLIPLAGIAVVVYIMARVISKFTGVYWSAKLSGMEKKVYRNLPACLLSQAGTTIGLTMIVAQQLPEVSANILTVMLSAVIFFEIIAPPLTRNILIKLGEAHAPDAMPDAAVPRPGYEITQNIFMTGSTSLYDERYLTVRLDEEIKRAKRHTRFFSLALISVDPVAAGKQAEDCGIAPDILKRLGEFIKVNVRDTDIISHSTSGSFMLLLPETDIEGANSLSERLQKQMPLSGLHGEANGHDPERTLSIGIASYPADAREMDGLVGMVTEMLEKSRKSRGNIVYSSLIANELDLLLRGWIFN